jgi:hypothetical protein
VGGVPGNCARNAYYHLYFHHPDFRQGATGHVNAAGHYRQAPFLTAPKSSQVNTLPIAKSQTRSKQNKSMQKFSSVYSGRGVLLPVLTSGGE